MIHKSDELAAETAGRQRLEIGPIHQSIDQINLVGIHARAQRRLRKPLHVAHERHAAHRHKQAKNLTGIFLVADQLADRVKRNQWLVAVFDHLANDIHVSNIDRVR